MSLFQSPNMKNWAIFGFCAGMIVVLLTENGSAQQTDRFLQHRQYMVQRYLIPEGIDNERVLNSMRKVPRHEFVRSKDLAQAYFDTALPIGFQQTISPPYIVAYMTQSIDPQPTDRVLEIGTGSGYQAAVLAEISKEVYSIEIVEGLGKGAQKTLRELKYDNVHVKVGDGFKGWPEHAPFDKIIVTCSPESVPKPLIEQLKEGGKMIIPVGERYQQIFYLLQKENGKLIEKKLLPTLFVPMTGESEEKRKEQPDPLHPVVVNGSFEVDGNKDGLTDNWHYQRQTKLVQGNAKDGNFIIQLENKTPGRPAQMLQGMAVDGSKISHLQIELWVQYKNIIKGRNRYQRGGILIFYYDHIRRPLGQALVGPFVGTASWEQISRKIPVPEKTREVILNLGLNGATGSLEVDAVSLTPIAREQSSDE